MLQSSAEAPGDTNDRAQIGESKNRRKKKPQMTKHYKPIGPSLHLLLPRERRRRRTGGD